MLARALVVAVAGLPTLLACGGGGDPVSADAGVPAADAAGADALAPDAAPPPRALGIDVSAAEGETFEEALTLARSAGIDFLTLPLNWRDIEPGPDDDFRFSSLNLKTWDRAAASGTLELDAGVLRWTESGVDSEQARLTTRYRLPTGALAAAVRFELVSETAGTEATLLLGFSDGASTGNRCEVGDHYAAVVLLGAGATAVATCEDGVFATGTVAPAATDSRVRIRRTASELIFEQRPGDTDDAFTTIDSLPLAGLPAEFSGPARPHLYFGNPAAGAVEIVADDFEVDGQVTWDDPADRFASDPAFDILGVVELVYGALPLQVALSIRTINTVTVEVPSDLDVIDPATGRVDFSDATLQARFAAFLAHVTDRIPSVELLSLSLGNEVDGYLDNSEAAWSQYASFVASAAATARTLVPGVPVGIKATHGGIAHERPAYAALLAHADAIMVTYYPLAADFSTRDPAVVGDDLDELIGWIEDGELPDLPVYILEAGYPTAPMSEDCSACNSSEARQAAFVSAVFEAWDRHAARIPAINFNWLTDVPAGTVAGWET